MKVRFRFGLGFSGLAADFFDRCGYQFDDGDGAKSQYQYGKKQQ